MVQQMSMHTDRQSLVFFPHQAVPHRHLYDSIADARQAHDIAVGEFLGRVWNRLTNALRGALSRARVRRELAGMDDRMLSDIGLTRGDIENVVAGRYPGGNELPTAVAVAEEAPVAKPDLVDAILRRAA